MLPNKIIQNGLVKIIIKNYQARENHSVRVYGTLRWIMDNKDVTMIRANSLLDRKLFAFSRLMPHTVHKGYRLKIIPKLRIFIRGIFINKDDARRFYGWLKLNQRG